MEVEVNPVAVETPTWDPAPSTRAYPKGRVSTLRPALLSLCLLSVPLQAQERSISVSLEPSPEVWNIRDVPTLLEELARGRGSALVVLNDRTELAKRQLADLLAEESLLPLGLRSLAVEWTSKLGRELCQRHGWTGGPRWALLGFRGEVAGEGNGTPTSGVVLQAFQATGCRSRLEVLRRWVKDQPRGIESRLFLLRELRRMGEALTYRALKRPQPMLPASRRVLEIGGQRFDADSTDVVPEIPLSLLTDSEDARIWEEYVGHLHLALPDWLPLMGRDRAEAMNVMPACLVASPRLQAAAKALAPRVEDALRTRPTCLPLWELLLAMGPNRPLVDVVTSLTPGPWVASENWPPPALRAAFLRDGQRHKDWTRVKAFGEPAWQDLLAVADTKGFKSSALVAGTWREVAEPLLEAYLRTGRHHDADKLVREWHQRSAWKVAAHHAARLALSCGATTLAESWQQLGA